MANSWFRKYKKILDIYIKQSNKNKISIKGGIIERMKILLSKTGLRELLRLELMPGN